MGARVEAVGVGLKCRSSRPPLSKTHRKRTVAGTAAAAGVLDWSSTDWPNLSTATIALRLSKRGKATYVWGKAGTVVNGGQATQTARFEFTAAETAALDSGVYDLQITATISGAIVTLVLTTLTVRPRVPTS